jgi:hypothetical protein
VYISNKFHKINLSTYIDKLDDLRHTKDLPKFLSKALEVRKQLLNYAIANKLQTIPLSDIKDGTKNFIYYEDKAILLNNDSWNYLFNQLIDTAEPITDKDLQHNTGVQVDNLENAIINAFSHLVTPFTTKNEHLVFLRKIVVRPTEMAKVVYIVLKTNILSYIRKNSYLHEYEIPYTMLAGLLGKTIYTYYIENDVGFISEMINAYNNKKELSIKVLDYFEEILKSIINKDNVRNTALYLELNIKDSALQNSMNDYLLQCAIKGRRRETNTLFTINDLLELLPDPHAKEVEALDNLNKLYISIGSLLIEDLVKQNVFSSSIKIEDNKNIII